MWFWSVDKLNHMDEAAKLTTGKQPVEYGEV